jgi:hypothetical protein
MLRAEYIRLPFGATLLLQSIFALWMEIKLTGLREFGWSKIVIAISAYTFRINKLSVIRGSMSTQTT